MFVIGAMATGYYFTAALGAMLYYIGYKLLLKTEDKSKQKLINIFGENPRFVWLLREGVEIQIAFDDLRVGDVIVISAGEMIPVDGAITDGMASINQHMLTGEEQPAEKGVGEEVFAATIVLAGRICVRVEKTGAETVAAQIADILRHTADFKTFVQTRGEAVADRWVLPTLGVSAFALSTLGPASAIAVISANFSEVLRIASPLSLLNFLNLASQEGILIKDGRSLELLSQVDTIIFDKTGTLTLEQPYVGALYTCNGLNENELLAYAAAAEVKQTHPIARAILQEMQERALEIPEVDTVAYEVGYGIRVQIADQLIRVGSARFMEAEGISISDATYSQQQQAHEQGASLVYVAIDAQLGGCIALYTTLRPEAASVLRGLRQRNLDIYLISGDHEQPTKRLAQTLGIDQYFAQVLPEAKAALVEQLQQEGRSVCFVGDGINDTIALKTAQVSISLRGASTAAIDTAQVLLLDGTLKQLDYVFDLARRFDANLKTSLAMTLGPGFICVGGVFLLHFGILSSIMFYNISFDRQCRQRHVATASRCAGNVIRSG